MAGSTWGEIFRISTWGESHGKGLGVVVDGCPAGLALSEEEPVSVEIKGRHDPIIVPRAVVVVEAMTAMTILDKMFVGMTSRLDRIVEFYRR